MECGSRSSSIADGVALLLAEASGGSEAPRAQIAA